MSCRSALHRARPESPPSGGEPRAVEATQAWRRAKDSVARGPLVEILRAGLALAVLGALYVLALAIEARVGLGDLP